MGATGATKLAVRSDSSGSGISLQSRLMDHQMDAERDSTPSFADAEADYGDDGESPLPAIDHNEVYSSRPIHACFIKVWRGRWGGRQNEA